MATSCGPSRFRGFSLVELMVAISTLAILTAIAIPRSRTVTRDYTVLIAAEQLAGELQRARLDAVRRNQSRTVTFVDSLHYQRLGGNVRALYGGAGFSALPATVTFNSMGQTSSGSGTMTVTFQGASRQVILTATGFASVQ